MPWKIVKGESDCPFEVVRADTGEHVACHPTEGHAMDHMAALYANTSDEQQQRTAIDGPTPPILYRAAAVDDVKLSERIITTIAVPYEQPIIVPGGYGVGRAQMGRPSERYEEVVSRGAFDGVESAPHRVRANRDHDPTRPVGKAIKFCPQDPTGLLTEIRIAKTELGTETLELAEEGVLSCSAGFALRANGRSVDRTTRRTRITSAHLDHIAFVMNPSYVGAEILSVRAGATDNPNHTSLDTPTPGLDQFVGDPAFTWAYERLHKKPS